MTVEGYTDLGLETRCKHCGEYVILARLDTGGTVWLRGGHGRLADRCPDGRLHNEGRPAWAPEGDQRKVAEPGLTPDPRARSDK